jgi:diguanylate cyclase
MNTARFKRSRHPPATDRHGRQPTHEFTPAAIDIAHARRGRGHLKSPGDSGISARIQTVIHLMRENRHLRASLDAERLSNAQLSAALDHQSRAALTDPLTGLYNRRAMDQQLDSLWADCGEGPFALLVLDIDYLKHINDTHGHLCGDTAIRKVAMTLRHCIRAGDSAFRFGGEEFLVLLPNTSLEGAISVAESIRDRIEAHNLGVPRDWKVPLTVSLGVASRKDHDDPISLFERADRALYQAKHTGRNRVVHENSLA